MNNYTLQVHRNAYHFGVGGLRPVRYASTEGEMCYELRLVKPFTAHCRSGNGDQKQKCNPVTVLRRICGDHDILHGESLFGSEIYDRRLLLCPAYGLL